jgi:hypothetical protein
MFFDANAKFCLCKTCDAGFVRSSLLGILHLSLHRYGRLVTTSRICRLAFNIAVSFAVFDGMSLVNDRVSLLK